MTNRPKWLERYGFERPPFEKDIADDELWLPERRKAVVDDIVLAARERHHALLVGEPGVGKTCSLRAVRRVLPEAGFRLTYCHNATLGRRDFYRQLCLALGLPPKATAASVFYSVTEHVVRLGTERVHPVLLLDEAQLLHQDVLDHLHILANYEWDSSPLISIVLVGLPDIWSRLSLGRNRSFWSRIHHRIHLGDADPADTVEYVDYRISRAGASRNPFGSDALALLHEASLGRLRDIDRLATAALKASARRRLKTCDHELMAHVIEADTRPQGRDK